MPNRKTIAATKPKAGRILISGSFCYDIIFNCAGSLGAAAAGAVFFAPEVRRVFGGCGGNIAYGLAQLGERPILAAAAGKDWQEYRAHLRTHNISDKHILIRKDAITATAFVINDTKGEQMTVFHPGASIHAHRQTLTDIKESITLAIVSPNAKKAMMKHTRELAKMKVPFIFDPGQALGLLTAKDLTEALTKCTLAIFNAKEYTAALATITAAASKRGKGGKQPKDKPKAKNPILDYAGAVIITNGAQGSRLMLKDGKTITCRAATYGKTADTTGCGDAYRAGLLYGMQQKYQWQKTLQLASTIAGIKAQTHGGQQYKTTLPKTKTLTKKSF